MQPGIELDISLARGIGEGSREALERLLNRHLGPVYRYVLRRLGPGKEQQASDITSAAFEQAMRKMRRYPRGERTVPMRLWLLRLANREISRARRNSGDLPPLRDDLDRLRDAISSLKGRESDAASMALFEEMTPQDIAAALGTSDGAAMKQLRRALRHMEARHFPHPQEWSFDE